MNVDFKPLSEAIGRARGTAVLKAPQVESHGWFCLTDGRIHSFNGISGTVTNSSLPKDLKCCVPAKRFAAAVAAVEKQSGTIEVTDGWMHIQAGNYSTKLPTFPTYDFPDLSVKDVTEFCSATNISEALKLVSLSMETDENKLVIYGCGIRNSYVYSTDGKRLTRAKLNKPATGAVSIGRTAVRQLAKMGEPDFLFKTGEYVGALYKDLKTTVLSRTLNQQFPFEAVDNQLLNRTDDEAVVIPGTLAEAVGRVKGLATDDETQLRLECAGGLLTISTVVTDGVTKDAVAFPSKDFKIKIKADSLHAVLKTLRPTRLDLTDVMLGDARMVVFLGDGYEHAVALMS